MLPGELEMTTRPLNEWIAATIRLKQLKSTYNQAKRDLRLASMVGDEMEYQKVRQRMGELTAEINQLDIFCS